ncbi:hypothetical protein [Curtobacterium sp. HSID17257]|uniref:hypothetical protein n=1 Tax=Curtobacterium sp. HSID17257 TaxID=2419510 RepID=UPI000F89495C|nr:hypothetical protein [Curtobacterium sp. HSID17257]RUQ04282.1 hypothetical protein D8M35_10300 [Curtobacterium sp. HSID17257]
MNFRPMVIGSAVVLSSCLAVGASASAFAAPGQHTSPAASSRSTTATTITDVQQEQLGRDASQYVKVTIAVSGDTVVRLLDPTGEVVRVEDGSPASPVSFLVKPTGADIARYTVDTGEGSTPRAVDLDFRGMPLSAPENLISETETDRISAAVARGQLTHEVEFEALPGAEVTVVVNGRSTVARASEYGVATVVVEFRKGENEVRAKQVLGAKQSIESVESWTFGGGEQPGDGNEGGERPGDGDQGGERPGDGDQGGEHVDRGSLRIDQEQGAELTPKDGKVTISGRASGGWVTATDDERNVLATTKVENGRWSVDVPAAPGRHFAIISLSATENGTPVADDTLNYTVTGDGSGSGGEQPGDGGAVLPVTDLTVDQSGTVHLDSHGFATYTGTAPGDSVRVLVKGSRPRSSPSPTGASPRTCTSDRARADSPSWRSRTATCGTS